MVVSRAAKQAGEIDIKLPTVPNFAQLRVSFQRSFSWQSWPRQHIRPVSTSQAMCVAGSRYSLVATPHLGSGVRQRQEPVGVQALIAQAPV